MCVLGGSMCCSYRCWWTKERQLEPAWRRAVELAHLLMHKFIDANLVCSMLSWVIAGGYDLGVVGVCGCRLQALAAQSIQLAQCKRAYQWASLLDAMHATHLLVSSSAVRWFSVCSMSLLGVSGWQLASDTVSTEDKIPYRGAMQKGPRPRLGGVATTAHSAKVPVRKVTHHSLYIRAVLTSFFTTLAFDEPGETKLQLHQDEEGTCGDHRDGPSSRAGQLNPDCPVRPRTVLGSAQPAVIGGVGK
jgi:hypothetical protein